MSDWRRKNEETDEADFAELMELEEELSYEDGYLHKKRSARQAELRKKRKRNRQNPDRQGYNAAPSCLPGPLGSAG